MAKTTELSGKMRNSSVKMSRMKKLQSKAKGKDYGTFEENEK